MNYDSFLYCFSNPDMPGLVKIGFTNRSPEDRLSEANKSDPFKPPSPYVIDFAKKVANAAEKEKTLHVLLAKYHQRRNPKREFFRVKSEEVKIFFDLIDGEWWGFNGTKKHKICEENELETKKRKICEVNPASEPVKEPTSEPVKEPTSEPVKEPTSEPVKEPAPFKFELQPPITLFFHPGNKVKKAKKRGLRLLQANKY